MKLLENLLLLYQLNYQAPGIFIQILIVLSEDLVNYLQVCPTKSVTEDIIELNYQLHIQ